jgi:hypothetical protein
MNFKKPVFATTKIKNKSIQKYKKNAATGVQTQADPVAIQPPTAVLFTPYLFVS